MYVRKTTNLDLIARLDEKMFGEEAEEELEGRIWWLAYVEGKIAGFAGLKVFQEGSRMGGYLCRAGVLKEYRGMGIQRALIDCRDREGRRLGLTMNITYTARDNYPSANNLIRCGYTLYDAERKYGLKDGLYFRKPLKERQV